MKLKCTLPYYSRKGLPSVGVRAGEIFEVSDELGEILLAEKWQGFEKQGFEEVGKEKMVEEVAENKMVKKGKTK